MNHDALVYGALALTCYVTALATSAALVRWILPRHLITDLGKGNRYIAIDGIRGYLAFGVYIHHSLATFLFLRSGLWDVPPYNFVNQMGKTSVAVFFMITALLFWGRALSKRDIDVKSFAISRIFRIYPLYLVVVGAVFVAALWKTRYVASEGPLALIKELAKWLLFRTPIVNGYKDTQLVVAGVTWTLLYEASFYLALPFLVWGFIKQGSIWRKLGALAVAVALCLANHVDFRIAAMFLGGAFAVWWTSSPKRVTSAQSQFAAIIALTGLAVVVIFLFEPFNIVGLSLLTLFFTVIASGNTLFGMLRTRAAQWMGEISYSIYLCHGIVLWILVQNLLIHVSGFQASNRWLIPTAIAITPLIIILSSLTYIFIERPFIDLGHRLGKVNNNPMEATVNQVSPTPELVSTK